jgi:hypothetical protein
MKTKVMLVIVLTALTILVGCREQEGIGMFGPSFEAESVQVLEARGKEFDAWVRSKGFAPILKPGGRIDGAGGHTQGDETKWYETGGGRYEIFLSVTLSARERVIRTGIDYRGRFSPEESRRATGRAREIYKDILLWFVTRPQSDKGSESDAKRIHDAYRSNFEWVDSQSKF